MKKLITLILTLICVLLISTQGTINIKAQDEIDGLENNQEVEANASIITETLDFVNNPTKAIKTINENKVKGAKDSTWNANKKILTLKGVRLYAKTQDVLLLPAGSTISIEGINMIRDANTSGTECTLIKVEEAGDLNISKANINKSSQLILSTNSYTSKTKAISVNGNLSINDGCTLIIQATNGGIYCKGDLTIGNVYLSANNINGDVECIYVGGKLKNTSEYTYFQFGQTTQSSPSKPALHADSFESYKDDASATINLFGRDNNRAYDNLEFDNTKKTLVLKNQKTDAIYINFTYIAKYTLNIKANNGVELYKDSTKLDESEWPYYFFKKGNDNVLYINYYGEFDTIASTAVHIGKGIKISGNNEGSSLIISQRNDGTDKNGLIADGSLIVKDAAVIAVYSNIVAGSDETNVTGVKAESIQLTSNSRLSVNMNVRSLTNGIETKSIKLVDSSILSTIYLTDSTNGIAVLINNPNSTEPIKMTGNSNIVINAYSKETGTPEALFIKTDKTIKETAGTFASSYDAGGSKYSDLVWKSTAGGYHYEEEDTSNGALEIVVFKKPSPIQRASGDMPYSNNAFHGNFVVKQADYLTARVGGSTYGVYEDQAKITNKTTGYDLVPGQDCYFEHSPAAGFELNKDYLNSLELGTYDLELSYPLGSKTFTYNIKLNVTKYQPAPDPGKKDESCEKVIGPTWHWNNIKGVCEEVGVVGTATR